VGSVAAQAVETFARRAVAERPTTLYLAGGFDLYTRPFLHDACAEARAQDVSEHLVVDMSAVDFIDGGGLFEVAELVRARRRLGDPSYVVVSSTFQQQLFRVSGLGDVLEPVPALPDSD
jgi:anti-anti-sigma factor